MDQPVTVETSDRRPRFIGVVIVIITFGIFGLWSLVAPLQSAALVPGKVMVKGSRKNVEHLKGGIVAELPVRDGDLVAAGDLLVLLDDTQARADKVLTDEIEAENEAALARESLSELTGTYVGDLAPLRTDFELPPLENTMDYWVKLATESNALLRSKHEAVAAAKDGIQEQKGGHYPTVDLVYSNQTSDVGYDNQQSPERQTEYIGVDINIPLYSGGSTSARVREAWATYYIIAREEEEATRREVLKRTREAWLNTRSSRKRIHAAQLSVRSATKSFEAMSKSFNYGTVTTADVLEALHARTRSERDYQNALYQYITNWLALKPESGILEDSDLQQVNSWLLAQGS